MSKKGIIIILVISIAIFGVLLFRKNTSILVSHSSPQSFIPTSTSAPTPTSVYSGTQNKQQPYAAYTVTLTARGFAPQTLTIKAGTMVTWVNTSGSEATVNSDPHPAHTAYPPLNLGQFNDGDSLHLLFNKPGRYGYHNHFDATQTGTIMVQ